MQKYWDKVTKKCGYDKLGQTDFEIEDYMEKGIKKVLDVGMGEWVGMKICSLFAFCAILRPVLMPEFSLRVRWQSGLKRLKTPFSWISLI